MTSQAPYRVLIADARGGVREALRWALESEGDLVVVAEACDGPEALRQSLGLIPDVVILATDLPKEDGFVVTRALKAQPAATMSQHAVGPSAPITPRRAPASRQSRAPVVVLLAVRDSADARWRGAAAGSDGFAAKGAGWAALIGEVRRALAVSRVCRRVPRPTQPE